MCVNFYRFLSYDLLMIFINIKCQWYFIMGKNRSSIFQVSMTYIRLTGNSCSKNSGSLCGVFNSDMSQFKARSFNKMKPPLSKNAVIEIVNITTVYIGGLKICFKVYIVEGVALICQSPNNI